MAVFFCGGFEWERDEMVQCISSDSRKADASAKLNYRDRLKIYNNIGESLDIYMKKLEEWRSKAENEWPLRESPRCFEPKCDRIRNEMELIILEIKDRQESSVPGASLKRMEAYLKKFRLSEILDLFSIHVGMLVIRQHLFPPGPSVDIMSKTADWKQLYYQNTTAATRKSNPHLDAYSIWSRLYTPIEGCDCHSCLRLGRFR
jgi:hypothetical protein